MNDAELCGIVDPDAAVLDAHDALPAQVAEDARRGLPVYDAGRSASTHRIGFCKKMVQKIVDAPFRLRQIGGYRFDENLSR